MKDLLNFDSHGRKRTHEEIADLCADTEIAFDETGCLRTANEIETIKFMRVLANNPEYFKWVSDAETAKSNKLELPTPLISVQKYEKVATYK